MRFIAMNMARMILAVLVLTASATASHAVQKHRPQADEDWTTYKNARFGYSLYYPAALFEAEAPPENGSGLTFVSGDGRGKIVVFGAHNSEGLSTRDYRRVLIEEFGGYDQLDYQPIGRTWFVLSGFRGDTIYYQKVMFSCSARIINVLSITFPTVEKPFYEPLIETIEDRFRTGRGEDTPQGC